MKSYQSYIICTSPRSGSTLLCKLLAATGKSGTPNSYFHKPSISDWAISLGITRENHGTEREFLEAIVDSVLKRGTGKSGMFGLRLQRHSFDYFIQKLGVLHSGLSNDLERFQAVFGNTLFIHLTRTNKLEQAISCVKATQTGLWHMAPDGTELERTSAPKEPVYDADAIAHELAELSVLDKNWEDWFVKEKIDRLRITYDQLSANPEGVLALILGHLGVNPQVAIGITPAVAKLADATNRHWMDRFLVERGND